MALVSPLKQDTEKAAREIDALQRLYNVYFLGGEEDPPKAQRTALDQLINKIRSQVATASNAADKFQANAVVQKYQLMKVKWDKTLHAIQTGQIPKPKKRE